MSKETSKTEIVETETIFLGKEHGRFLDTTIEKIQKASNYKTSKSQIIRLLIDCMMRRTLYYDTIHDEESLRKMLFDAEDTEPTRIRKK